MNRRHTPLTGKQIPARIVVGSVRWIGDAVMTIPALRRLRLLFPESHITLAAGDWARDVFATAEYLDEVWCASDMPQTNLQTNLRRTKFYQLWAQANATHARGFDAALILQNSFASALVPFLARIPRRAGYATDGRSILLTDAVKVPVWRATRHEVFYYLNLVEAFAHKLKCDKLKSDKLKSSNRRRSSSSFDIFTKKGFEINSFSDAVFDDLPVAPNLHVSRAQMQAAREFLIRNGVDAARPLVLMCPGSTNSRAKRWHAGSYAQLADKLVRERNAQIAFIGASAELDVSQAVVTQMKESALILTGRTILSETIAILAHADLVISNDTGPAHIAAALRRPTLVIFGPTNPVTTRPLSETAEVLRQPPACAPCMLRDCPIDHRCMTRISVDEVFKSALRKLNATEELNHQPLTAVEVCD